MHRVRVLVRFKQLRHLRQKTTGWKPVHSPQKPWGARITMPPMGFLYPGALFFALIPLLVIAYLVRERPRGVMVSSVLGYRALRALKSERPWGWPRLDWLFLIEMLILSLAVLAIAEPYVIHQRTPVAVVLDNSAAMQAGDTAGRPLRGGAPHTGACDSGSKRCRGQPLSDRPAAASGRRSDQRRAGAPRDWSGSSRRRPAERGLGGQAARRPSLRPSLHPMPVRHRRSGQPAAAARSACLQGGRAAAEFRDRLLRGAAAREFGSGALKAQLTVANFSSQTQNLRGRDRRRRQNRWPRPRRMLGRARSARWSFPTLAPASVYRADLKPADAFALDNVAYATPPSGAEIQVLFVSPTPADAAGLSSLPQIKVRTLSPEQYSPDRRQSGPADLRVRHAQGNAGRQRAVGDAARRRRRSSGCGCARRDRPGDRLALTRPAHRRG